MKLGKMKSKLLPPFKVFKTWKAWLLSHYWTFVIKPLTTTQRTQRLQAIRAKTPVNNKTEIMAASNEQQGGITQDEINKVENDPQLLFDVVHHRNIEPEVSIDWNNSVNNSHHYAEIWKQKDATYLKTLHQLNRSCSERKRASGKTKIISNQGKENSLIFTLNFDGQIRYDTLENCVHPDNEVHQNAAEQKEVLYSPNRFYQPKGGLPPYIKVFNLKSPISKQLDIFIELAKVRELLKTTNPNCEYRDDGEARSPLVAAARNGHLGFVKFLVEQGTNVNKKLTGEG